MTQKFEYTILDMIESASRVQKTAPLNLGGTGGAGGGVGVPPGGFIGQLPQYRVAYDTVELASSGTLPSGVTGISGWSLVDNLNHIRYRLHELEIASGGSGAIIVQDWDGTPTINPTTKIIFSGASVTDMGGGIALVAVSGGTGGITQAAADARYLKLDASNDPLTAQLDIVPSAAGDGGVYISTTGDSFPLDVEQLTTNTNVTSPAMLVLQYTDGTGSYNSNSQLLHGLRYKLGTGTYSSSWIKLEVFGSGTAFEVAHDGKAYSNGSLLVTDAPSDGNAYSRKNAAWVVAVASGGSALTVQEADGSPIVSNVTNVTFSGATVTDLGGGTALVTISGYTQEEVEDIVGAMVTGNTETGITVTYDDATGKLNFDAQTAGDARYEKLITSTTFVTLTTANDTVNAFTNQGGRNLILLDLSGLTADRTLFLGPGSAFGTTVEIAVLVGHATYKCFIAPKSPGVGSTTFNDSTAAWDNTLQVARDSIELMYTAGHGWEILGSNIALTRQGLPLIVEESNGSPSVNNVDKIIFSGATVTSLGSGDVLVTISGGSALTVEESDGSPSVTNVDKILFSGATVTNLGNGDALVTISGISDTHFDTRYLKLNASNDPITGTLEVSVVGQTNPALNITSRNFAGLNINQITEANPTSVPSPALTISRTQYAGDTSDFSSPAIRVHDSPNTGPVTGDFLEFKRSNVTKFNVTQSGHAYDNGELLITDAPSDGNMYARLNSEWTTLSGLGEGSGGDIYIWVDGTLAVASGVTVPILFTKYTEVSKIYAYVENTGTAGTTIVDANLNGTTLYSNPVERLQVAYNASPKWTSSVPDVLFFNEGDVLTFDIDQIASGSSSMLLAVRIRSTSEVPPSAGIGKRIFTFTCEGDLPTFTGHTRLYNVFGENLTITEVFLASDTAPTGADIIVDINKNGTTLFTTQSNRPKILATANTGSSTTIENNAFNAGDYLTMDIDQRGSTVHGSDLTVHVVFE